MKITCCVFLVRRDYYVVWDEEEDKEGDADEKRDDGDNKEDVAGTCALS